MIKSVQEGELKGKILIPASKSDGQRAILAAALAKGTSEILNIGESDDVQSMLRNVQLLGAEVEINGSSVAITGTKQFPENIELNVGESGLGLRLLTSICAAHDGMQILNGEGSILTRDQSFFENHFSLMGVEATSNSGKLPLEIKGKLRPGNYTVDGSESSQYISGLLMALPLLNGDSVLTVQDLKSKPYVEMTLETLRAFGIKIQSQANSYFIKGNQEYQATDYTVEADWSSASYWLVAAALGHDLRLSGLNRNSKQADKALLDVLELANCKIIIQNGEIKVDGAQRKAFDFDATNCPDLFPSLVTLAAFCNGISRIKGAHRLINKESNRCLVLQKEFAKLGLNIELKNDEMIIHGGQQLKSTEVDSNNDHRIAMCLAIAATRINNGLIINGAEAVSKSYPDFWRDLSLM